MNPSDIRFTQDSISQTFKKGGGLVDDLSAGLKNGTIKPEDVQPIRVFEKDGLTFTLDNRRLYAFQQAGVKIPTVRASPFEVASELTKKLTTTNEGISIVVRGKP